MRIGILTSGGDCPGINAAIRGVIKTADYCYHIQTIGIRNGFEGLLTADTFPLDGQTTNLLTSGGTVLGTSRCKPFRVKTPADEQNPQRMRHTMEQEALDGIICIGGGGTMKTAAKLQQIGIPAIGIPKTIDNDLYGTDQTFGFDTAVQIATEAIDRLHSTASAHRRTMVLEVMGHKAGWIALHAGMAGGADIILLPEIPYKLDHIYAAIRRRQERGRLFTIVVVAEGIATNGIQGPAEYLSRKIEEATGTETRYTVLGYVQRGGSPTPYDRNLSTLLGAKAAELAHLGEWGRMIALQNGIITSLPLEETAGRLKLVTPDSPLLVEGQRMGICFG